MFKGFKFSEQEKECILENTQWIFEHALDSTPKSLKYIFKETSPFGSFRIYFVHDDQINYWSDEAVNLMLLAYHNFGEIPYNICFDDDPRYISWLSEDLNTLAKMKNRLRVVYSRDEV